MDKTAHQLVRTLKLSLQSFHFLYPRDRPIMSALPNRPLVTEAGEETIPGDDDTSASEYSKSGSEENSDEEDNEQNEDDNFTVLANVTPGTSTMTPVFPFRESKVDNMIQASNFEFGRGTVVRGANQLEGVGRTSFGNVVQETAQRHMYHEDMTELGVTIRRYKNERSGSLSPMSFDFVGAEGLGVTENPSFGDHGIDKCSSEELLTLQVNLTKILNFFMKNYALRKKK